MKKPLIILLFTIVAIGSSLYYFNQKKQTTLFDAHIIDTVHTPHINPLFEKADAAKYDQDYPKAKQLFQALLSKKLSAADSQYVLNQLAFINLTTDEDSIAHIWLKKIEKTYPLSISAQADYFYNIGTWASHTFKPKMANDYLQKALVLYKKTYGDKHLKTALCLTQLGLMHYQFGKNFMDSTKLYLSLADTIFQSNVSTQMASFSAECVYGLSKIERLGWDNEKALLHINTALNLLEAKHRDKEILYALCLNLKALVVRKEGSMHPEKKTFYFQQMDSLIKKAVEVGKGTSSYKLQDIYVDIIRMKSGLKDSTQCQYYLEQLRQLLTVQPEYYSKIKSLKGYYYLRQRDTLTSMQFYRQFWDSHSNDTCKNALFAADASHSLFLYYNTILNYDSALYFIKQNIIAATGDQGYNVSWSYLLSPSFYEKNKRVVVSFPFAANVFYNKYEKQKDKNDLKQAYQIVKTTDSLLFDALLSANDETLLSYQKEYGSKDNAFAIRIAHSLYKETKKLEYLEFGFKLSERFKSQVLFRNLYDSRATNNTKSIIDSIQMIKSDLAFLKNNDNKNSIKLALSNRLEQLYKVLEKRNPEYYKSKILQPTPSLKDIQTILKPSQLLVNYSLTNEKSYRILISKTNCDFQIFDDFNTINNQISQLRSFLTAKDNTHSGKSYKDVAMQLYKNLLGNIPPQYEGQKELLIITDKNLALLPFEALVEPNRNSDTTFDKMAYALYRYSFTYTSSFKIYENNAPIKLPLKPKVAAFTYDAASDELPYSSKEIQVLKNIYGTQLGSYIGSECSKENFFNCQKDFDIIHLALHASSNPNRREDNKIYFSPKHKEPLYDLDLGKMQSKVKLLVLSACQTAEGKIEAGEGTYSLSRSFLQSGIPNVIASLWKIDNASTSDILTVFYKQLAQNNAPAIALHQAKINYIKTADRQTAHPSYWAGLLIFN